MDPGGAHLRRLQVESLPGRQTGRDESGRSHERRRRRAALIGCRATQHFRGRIDEVRIYDRALEQGEVAADKITSIQTQQAALVAEEILRLSATLGVEPGSFFVGLESFGRLDRDARIKPTIDDDRCGGAR